MTRAELRRRAQERYDNDGDRDAAREAERREVLALYEREYAAGIETGRKIYREQIAAAQLRAAAPDLLAACLLALDVLRDQHAAFREAIFAVEAAIAKAKGKSA